MMEYTDGYRGSEQSSRPLGGRPALDRLQISSEPQIVGGYLSSERPNRLSPDNRSQLKKHSKDQQIWLYVQQIKLKQGNYAALTA